MRPSRILFRTAFVALASSVAFASADATTYRGITNVRPGHVAWIYRDPDVGSPHVGYLKAGDLQVRTLACRHLAKGGWCHVMSRGTRGWVQDRFLKAAHVMRA